MQPSRGPELNPGDPSQGLHIYIYEYLLKRQLPRTAQMFLSEANIDPNSVSPQNIPVNSQQGLLAEWWAIFWDLYAAQLRDGSKVTFADGTMPPQAQALAGRQGAIDGAALARQGRGFPGRPGDEAGPSTVTAIQPPGRGTAQVKAVTGPYDKQSPVGPGAMGKPRAKTVAAVAMAANGAGRKGESEPNSPQVPNSPMTAEGQQMANQAGSPLDGLNVNSPSVMGPGGPRFAGLGVGQGGPMQGGRGMAPPQAAMLQQQQRLAAMQQQQHQMAAAAAAAGGHWPFPQGQMPVHGVPPNSPAPGMEGGIPGQAGRPYPGFHGDAIMQQMAQQMKAAAAQQKAKGASPVGMPGVGPMNAPPEFANAAGRGGPQAGGPMPQLMYGKWPAGMPIPPEVLAQQQKFRHQMMQLPPGHPQQQQFLMQQKVAAAAAAAAAAGNPALLNRMIAAGQASAAMMRKESLSNPGTPGPDGHPMSPAVSDPASPQVGVHAALAAAAAAGQPLTAEQLKQLGVSNPQQMMMLLSRGRMGPPGPMAAPDGSHANGPGPAHEGDEKHGGRGGPGGGRKRKSPGTQGDVQSPSGPGAGSPAPGSEGQSSQMGQPGMSSLPIAGPGAAAALQQHAHTMMMMKGVMGGAPGPMGGAMQAAAAGHGGGPVAMGGGAPGPPPGPPPEVPTADDPTFFMDDAVNDFLAGGDMGLSHEDSLSMTASSLGVPSVDGAGLL